jgi:hypothetical protein
LLKIPDIYSYISANADLHIYVRSTFDNMTSLWIPADQFSGYFNYEILNGELRIHAKDIDCNFDPSIYDVLIDWN